MIAKVVGVQHQDYKLDNGYAFKGIKVHAIDTMTMNSGLEGQLTTTFKIAADSPLINVPQVGKEYTVYFNQKGGVDFISPYQPPTK